MSRKVSALPASCRLLVTSAWLCRAAHDGTSVPTTARGQLSSRGPRGVYRPGHCFGGTLVPGTGLPPGAGDGPRVGGADPPTGSTGTGGLGYQALSVWITTPVTSTCRATKNGWAAGGLSFSSLTTALFISSLVTASG